MPRLNSPGETSSQGRPWHPQWSCLLLVFQGARQYMADHEQRRAFFLLGAPTQWPCYTEWWLNEQLRTNAATLHDFNITRPQLLRSIGISLLPPLEWVRAAAMQILWKSSSLPVASQFYPSTWTPWAGMTTAHHFSAGRLFSAISSVKLAYDECIPPNGNRTNSPLVILHGLLFVITLISFVWQ